MNAESAKLTSQAIDRMVTDNKNLHDKLIDYMHSHDTLKHQVRTNTDDLKELSNAVLANSKVTSIANKIIWGGGIVLAGALGTFGKDLVKLVF